MNDQLKCCEKPDESTPVPTGNAGRPITVCRNCFESGEPVSFPHALVLLMQHPNMKITNKAWEENTYIQLAENEISILHHSPSGSVEFLPDTEEMFSEEWIKYEFKGE